MYLTDRTVLMTDESTVRRIVRDEVQQALNDACGLVREQASGTYSRKETAKLLKCSLPTLKKMVSDGTLHPSKVKGKVLFRKLEVETLISGNA